VSATAYCTDEGVPQLMVRVSASDPQGNANLGQCAGDSQAGSDKGSFSSGGACCVRFYRFGADPDPRRSRAPSCSTLQGHDAVIHLPNSKRCGAKHESSISSHSAPRLF